MIETKRLLIRHFCAKDTDECYQSWGKDANSWVSGKSDM